MNDAIKKVFESATTKMFGKEYNAVYTKPKELKGYIPTGSISDPDNRERYWRFANDLKAFDAETGIKRNVRGWGYLLESKGKIAKTEAEFKKCGAAIAVCRKANLLPMDFVKEDQDETRHFKGIIEETDPTEGLMEIQELITDKMNNIAESNTGFWKDEKYYLMMSVEKGDLKEVLAPICQEYHIPIVSTKGRAPLLILDHIAKLAQKAEENKLTPVLLLFYDFDIVGRQMSDNFKEYLEEIKPSTRYDPEKLVIKRVGLNIEDIKRYNLPLVEDIELMKEVNKFRDNPELKYTKKLKHADFIEKYGAVKCEADALFISRDTLAIAEKITRKAIEYYYGKDAVERFRKKMEDMKTKNPDLYTIGLNRVMEDLNTLILSEESKRKAKTSNKANVGFVPEITIDCLVKRLDFGFGYGHCSNCYEKFEYQTTDIGRPKRCSSCDTLMLLKEGSEPSLNYDNARTSYLFFGKEKTAKMIREQQTRKRKEST